MHIIKLRDLANIQTGPFGSQLHQKDYAQIGTPIVTVEHLGKRTFTKQNLPFVSSQDKLRLKKYVLNEGDIVFSRVGAIDRSSYVDKAHEGWLYSGRCLRIRPCKMIYPLYLYYYLQLKQVKDFIYNIAVGATMPSINTRLLGEIDVLVPDLSLQQKIADKIAALDDKIELNEKINDNLQQQAQAIYTLFFVKNADVSWAKGHLSNLVNIKYGKDHKNLSDGIYPVYGSGGIIRHAEKFLYDKESVLIPRKGTLNNVMYVNQPFWSVDTMFYTEMKLPNIAKFVFHFIKSKDLDALNEGSAVPSMTTSLLNAMEVLIPPQPILKRFEAIVSPMYNIMQKNAEQNKTLSGLRNCLLFPLITNQIHL